MGVQNGKAADDVGNHILQRQGKCQGQHAGQGHDAGDVNAQCGGGAEAGQQVDSGPHQRENQTVGRFFQFGFFQGFAQQCQYDFGR